ncbi:hypothetical protein [Bradyrhizobium sp. LMG 9283]|uniref:hypothetical protein n=1 Tax=Bradyrhizobium sp. LMG 9283 TaxID=592064 RepID=UPI00388D1C93
MEEKIREAIENESSRHAAIAEAAGAVAPLRDRLRENEEVQASFTLLLDAQMYDAHAAQWWVDFARIDRPEFEKVAAVLVGPQGALEALRKVVSAANAPS